MPIGSPTAGFNVGHDVTVVVLSPISGAPLTFGNVTDFDSQPVTKSLESSPLSAPPLFGDVPHGWSGSLMVDRASSATDDTFAALEASYWAGKTQAYGGITEYIQELNGAVSQYTYDNVVFTLKNAGKKGSQAKITMSISFRASQRRKIV